MTVRVADAPIQIVDDQFSALALAQLPTTGNSFSLCFGVRRRSGSSTGLNVPSASFHRHNMNSFAGHNIGIIAETESPVNA